VHYAYPLQRSGARLVFIGCKLRECRTLWGERERAAQWFGNVAEFEQGQNRCCQHHMPGKQRVATVVFSSTITLRWYVLRHFVLF